MFLLLSKSLSNSNILVEWVCSTSFLFIASSLGDEIRVIIITRTLNTYAITVAAQYGFM